jgi:hypothetical protein
VAAPKLLLRLSGVLYPYHLWWWRRALRSQSAVSSWNHEHGAIFIHIPKTAGTSVLAALGISPAFDTHAPSAAYRAAYPDLYRRAYKFTFVRDPWDRFASTFHFFKYGTAWSLQRDWASAFIGDLSFSQFVHRLEHPLFRARVMSERFFWPQTFWLGRGGRLEPDIEVYRFERLGEALNSICGRLGVPAPAETPHLRQVDREDTATLYDERTRAIIGRLYRNDIATFGYGRVGGRD